MGLQREKAYESTDLHLCSERYSGELKQGFLQYLKTVPQNKRMMGMQIL